MKSVENGPEKTRKGLRLRKREMKFILKLVENKGDEKRKVDSVS